MLVATGSFLGLILLPVNFPYWAFGACCWSAASAAACSSRRTWPASMSSVPARQRGAAAGMRTTFQNTGTVVSIGVFFSLMIAGLAASLPGTLYRGLIAHDVPAAGRGAVFPPARGGQPVRALLGFNPMAALLPASVLHALPTSQAAIPHEQGISFPS